MKCKNFLKIFPNRFPLSQIKKEKPETKELDFEREILKALRTTANT